MLFASASVVACWNPNTPERIHDGFAVLIPSGQFIIAKIEEFDPEIQRYTLEFVKGPYWHDEGIVNLDESEPVSKLGERACACESKSKMSPKAGCYANSDV